MIGNWLLRSFNRQAARANPDEIIRALGNLRGKTVADVGSGGGYYVLKFAALVGEQGQVLAIDNRQANLDYVRALAKKEGYYNMRTVVTEEGTLPVEAATVDLFFSRNAFHHLPNPLDYFRQLRVYLRDQGRIAIIDHKKTGGFNFVNLFGHYSDEQMIVTVMEQAGYRQVKHLDMPENQSFNIFEKYEENKEGD